MLVSVVIFFAGMYLLGTIDMNTPRYELTLYMIITGLGMGCSFSMTSLATQHNVEPQRRGIVTSTNIFKFRRICFIKYQKRWRLPSPQHSTGLCCQLVWD
mgnify:CR=1 FL=1|jgi:hypothetical protein